MKNNDAGVNILHVIECCLSQAFHLKQIYIFLYVLLSLDDVRAKPHLPTP